MKDWTIKIYENIEESEIIILFQNEEHDVEITLSQSQAMEFVTTLNKQLNKQASRENP